METKFIAGKIYTQDEIEQNGFILTKTTTIVKFYRKGKVLLAFGVPKPLEPKLHKLIYTCTD